MEFGKKTLIAALCLSSLDVMLRMDYGIGFTEALADCAPMFKETLKNLYLMEENSPARATGLLTASEFIPPYLYFLKESFSFLSRIENRKKNL